MRKFIFILLSIVLWSISAKAIAQSGDNSGIISNHEIAAADLRIRDPFILADTKTKTYYLYRQIANGRGDSTEGVRGVEVYESQNLEIWKGPKVVYQQPANFWANAQVWAPEVHLYEGKYYLFVTFSANQSINGSNGQWLPIRGTQILVSDKAVTAFHQAVEFTTQRCVHAGGRREMIQPESGIAFEKRTGDR